MAKMILNERQLKNLENVILECEKKTAGEIRLIIARRSSAVGHVAPLIAAFLGFILVSLMWALHLPYSYWTLGGSLLAIICVAYGVSHLDFVRRWLTPKEDLASQVWNRAQREFYGAGMEQTRDRTGILLFLSLMERQAVVLADRGIAGKLPNETWVQVVQEALDGAKKGYWEPSLQAALEHCGKLLAQHFPVRPGDHDELTNRVLVLD